ncbi:hypothetical protein D3C73_1390230 [compost metagenome]
MVADGFVITQRFLHQFPAARLKLGQMPALMHAKQQRVNHIEDDLLVIAFAQRIGPHRGLLRCQRQR